MIALVAIPFKANIYGRAAKALGNVFENISYYACLGTYTAAFVRHPLGVRVGG